MLTSNEASEKFAKWFIEKMKDTKSGGYKYDMKDISGEDSPLLIMETLIQRSDLSSLNIAKYLIENGTNFDRMFIQRLLEEANNEQINGRDSQSCLVDTWVSKQRTAIIDFSAGPFDWGPIIQGEGVKSRRSLPQVPHFGSQWQKGEREAAEISLTHEIRIQKEQLETTANFFRKICIRENERVKVDDACITVKKRMDDLHKSIDRLSKQKIGKYSPKEINNERLTKGHSFLSELSATVSTTLRHLVVPPVPLYPTTFHSRVSIELIIVIDHEMYDPLGAGGFDYELFKHEVLKLKLPQQNFSFSKRTIRMIDDPLLSTAFSTSIRHIVLPSLTTQHMFVPEKVSFIDSIALRDSLLVSNRLNTLKDKEIASDSLTEDSVSSKKVKKLEKVTAAKKQSIFNDNNDNHKILPIFFFSTHRKTPLLVDKYYLAKSLKDMIVVVQSQGKMKSRVSCNGELTSLNLRNPLRAALAAVAQNIGGVISTHITYNDAHHNAAQNWLWSVGDNPLSQTSHGHSFNRLQIDSGFRNQLVATIQEGVERINNAFSYLNSLPTEKYNVELLPLLSHSIHSLRESYSVFIQQCHRAASDMISLNFQETVSTIQLLKSSSKM